MGKKPKFTFSLTIETDDTDSGTCEVIIDLMDIDKNVLIPELITVVEFDFKIRDISKYTEEEIHSIYKELEEYKDKNYASLLDF